MVRNKKRSHSITPDARAPVAVTKVIKMQMEGREDLTPKGPPKSKEEVRSNIFGVQMGGGRMQTKLEKCRKCEDRMMCIVELVEEGKIREIKCQGCWMEEKEEWEMTRREKEQENCRKCGEKDKKIEELDEELAGLIMDDMGRMLGQSQATQGEGCRECVEKGEKIRELEEKIQEVEDQVEMNERNCEECEGNRVKVSEMEQMIKEYEESRREDGEDREDDSMEVEEMDGKMELQSKIARLEAEVGVWRDKMEEANEVIKERNEVVESMSRDMERFKNQKDEYEEKWQALKEKMGKIMEYCKEGGNNQEEHSEEEQDEGMRQEMREKIIVVGDSHMTYIKGNMKMKDEDSVSAKSGAGIREVMEKAVEQAKGAEGRVVLFICGGGNSLKALGRKTTVEVVMEGLREIKKEENVRVIMLGILPRPAQTAVYEEARVESNIEIKRGIQRLKEEGQNVEFLELDEVLKEDLYERRLIHLNWDGMWRLGRLMSGKLEGDEKIEEEENENQASDERRRGIFGKIKRVAEEGRGAQKGEQGQERRRNEELERMRGNSNYSNFINKIDRGRGNGGYSMRGNGGRRGYGDRGEMGRGQGRGGPSTENRGGGEGEEIEGEVPLQLGEWQHMGALYMEEGLVIEVQEEGEID